MDKDATLTAFRAAFNAMSDAVAGAYDDALTRRHSGGWSARDVLAHFAGYHDDMAAAIAAVGRGERPAPPDGLTDDERNALYAERAATRPVAEVITDWRAAFEHCYQAAQTVPDSVFGAPRGPGAWIAEETAHYHDHVADVRGWLGRA
ncbi:MAG TPA: maleylpyruvate isomerase N-terminal domain-containing protein [Dehalococcoidia bacterium]|jgi:hypothetical protein